MGKARTKLSVWDTLLTETQPGVWNWQTRSGEQMQCWAFADAWTLNLLQLPDSGEPIPVGFFNDLREAVAYTIGFSEGVAAYARLSKQTRQAVRDLRSNMRRLHE